MKCFNPLMKKYARQCAVRDSSGEITDEMTAYIYPLRYKNKMYLYGVNTEIGYNPEGYYLYVGPPDADICGDGLTVECGSDSYRIDRAEKVWAGDEIFYIWAIIRKTVEDEEDTE